LKQKQLIRIIKDLPQVDLKLIDLSWKMVDENGNADIKKILPNSKLIEEAISQANSYIEDTKFAIGKISRL